MLQTITATFDGTAFLPEWPLDIERGRRYIVTIQPIPVTPEPTSAWDVLKKLTGTVDAPEDWSAQHDHYLYGTPKHNE